MRSFIVSVIIAAAIIFACFFHTYHIEKVSVNLLKSNNALHYALENEDFESAEILTENMTEYIKNKKFSLAAIMDHNELNKIETNLAELDTYIKNNVKADALAKCSTIDVILRNMPQNYRLKIENIL